MIGRPRDIGQTALRMVLSLGAAFVAAEFLARLSLQPASFITPVGPVLVIALLFVFWPVEGLAAFLVFDLVANTVDYWLPGGLGHFDEVGLLVLAAIAVVRYRVWPLRRPLGVAEWGIGLLVVAGILSSLAAGVPLEIWVPGLLLLLKGVAFFYVVSLLPLRPEEVLRAGVVVLLAAGLIVALGAWELVAPAEFQRALGLPQYHAQRGGLVVIKSIFLHPALYGWLAVFVSLFIYAWAIIRRAWWLLPLALLFDAAAFFSGRRTPILGLVLAIGVALIWVAWRSRSARSVVRTWVPITGAIVLLLAAFLPVVGGFYADTPGTYLDAPEAITQILSPHPDAAAIRKVSARTALYVGSVAVARDFFPLGGGLGRWGSFMSRAEYSPLYARYGVSEIPGLSRRVPNAINDTFWPSVLGETGVFGLLGFAIFIGTVFIRFWRVTPPDDGAMQVFALGGLLVFVQGLIASLTAGTYVAPPIAYFVLGTGAAALAVMKSRSSNHGADAVLIEMRPR